MIKDPLYRKILDRLAGPLVPDDFEACMGDLLREVFPGLVPVPGGNDAGMDGAVASSEGEPFPLVCTTSSKVEVNLVQSLDSFLERGLSSRKVVLATSQALTPARRRKLHKLARDKGFTLLQIIERQGIAFRLYRSSQWRRDLLDLPGNPSALSIVPPTRRPLIDLTPIGRDPELRWLKDGRGDRILSGEPGSGKTYLLHHLMLRGWEALFLVDDDDGHIADALRDQRPRVVVVDDAHAEPERLVRLRHLRQEIGAQFDLLAVTWEGGRGSVIEALGGLPESRVHKLELLTRREILEVIRQVGIEASDQVLGQLVDQSLNKPGLAVTIATLWMQGAWQEIREGTVLRRTLTELFRGLVSRDPAPVLASFALGGEAGMELTSVAEQLQVGRAEIWSVTNSLAAGGVLSNLEGSRLAVRPEVLRSALLREVFFPALGPSMDFRGLLARAPSFDRAVEAIALARLYRAKVSDSDLRHLVVSGHSRRAWQLLAASSEENAVWALKHYPNDVVHIAEAALRRAPEAAIRALLDKAAEVPRDFELRERPLKALGTWVREPIQHRPEETIRRRRMVTRLAQEYLQSEGKRALGIQAICIALQPTMEGAQLDPIEGRSITMTQGHLSLDQLREIEILWNQIRDRITKIDAESWNDLKSLLWYWIHPEYTYKTTQVSEEVRSLMHDFAAKVLLDLAPLTRESPGLTEGFRKLGEGIGLVLGLASDPTYVALFPPGLKSSGWEAWAHQQQTSMRELALILIARPPLEVIAELQRYEQDARRVGHTWPRNTPMLCRELASLTTEPEVWIAGLVSAEAVGDLVLPFLEKAARIERPGWEEQTRACLESDLYAWVALSVVLRMDVHPAGLLRTALEETPHPSRLVEDLSLRKEIPLATLQAVLRHSDKETALAAAIGEWLSDPEGEVRDELWDEWKAAILNARIDESLNDSSAGHWLPAILTRSPDLAFEWSREFLLNLREDIYISPDGMFSQVMSALDSEKRSQLLANVHPGPASTFLIDAIVRQELGVYRELLKRPDLASYHLEPLRGIRGETWVLLVMEALDAGHEPERIATATIAPPHSWWGSGKEFWNEWDEAFSRFENHTHPRVRETARAGRQIAQRLVEQANREERRQALNGF